MSDTDLNDRAMTGNSGPATSNCDLLTAKTAAGPTATGPDQDAGAGEVERDFVILPRCARYRPAKSTAALALAAAAGFLAGAYTPRHPANTNLPTPAGNAGTASTGLSPPCGTSLPGSGQPGTAHVTSGKVEAVKGAVVYITGAHGQTIQIKISRSTSITDTTVAQPTALSQAKRSSSGAPKMTCIG